MDNILITDDLCKNYGKNKILKNVSLSVPEGSIFGLVGKNGAGKTTLMRVITGLQDPTSGTYSLCGRKNTDRGIRLVRRRVGALVETPALYKNMSAYDNLKLQYITLGLPSYDDIPDLIKLVGLENTGKKHAGKFSLGMRQRLGIAVALCGKPDILVLDEPINGLDPQGIIEIRELLIKINKEQKTTIIISSHILDELSRLATHYAFIDNGRILKEISAEDLTRTARKAAHIVVSDSGIMCRILDKMSIRYEVTGGNELDIFDEISVSKLVLEASKENVEIIKYSEQDESLEGYFMNLVGSEE